jgi:hypothetical protein
LAADLIVTVLPFLAALALVAVGLAPFVGPFALAVLLVALGLWGLWKLAADLLALRGENVFRLAKTSELFGRGGPDDPDFVLVPRHPRSAEEEAPTFEDTVTRVSSTDRPSHGGDTESLP